MVCLQSYEGAGNTWFSFQIVPFAYLCVCCLGEASVLYGIRVWKSEDSLQESVCPSPVCSLDELRSLGLAQAPLPAEPCRGLQLGF